MRKRVLAKERKKTERRKSSCRRQRKFSIDESGGNGEREAVVKVRCFFGKKRRKSF